MSYPKQNPTAGQAICSSGVIEHCIKRINQEVHLSIESLGEFADKPGCQNYSLGLIMCTASSNRRQYAEDYMTDPTIEIVET